jgi:hypothetical protein
VADDRDAEILQIISGQGREEVALNHVVAERRFECPRPRFLSQAATSTGRLHSARWDNRLRSLVCKARTNSGRESTAN